MYDDGQRPERRMTVGPNRQHNTVRCPWPAPPRRPPPPAARIAALLARGLNGRAAAAAVLRTSLLLLADEGCAMLLGRPLCFAPAGGHPSAAVPARLPRRCAVARARSKKRRRKRKGKERKNAATLPAGPFCRLPAKAHNNGRYYLRHSGQSPFLISHSLMQSKWNA